MAIPVAPGEWQSQVYLMVAAATWFYKRSGVMVIVLEEEGKNLCFHKRELLPVTDDLVVKIAVSIFPLLPSFSSTTTTTIFFFTSPRHRSLPCSGGGIDDSSSPSRSLSSGIVCVAMVFVVGGEPLFFFVIVVVGRRSVFPDEGDEVGEP